VRGLGHSGTAGFEGRLDPVEPLAPYNPAMDRSRGSFPGPDPAKALAEIDAALARFEADHDRKKDQGFPGWVLEDISRHSATFRSLIERHGEPGGAHRKDAERLEREDMVPKARMLQLHGILASLRDDLAGVDADRAPGPRGRPTD